MGLPEGSMSCLEDHVKQLESKTAKMFTKGEDFLVHSPPKKSVEIAHIVISLCKIIHMKSTKFIAEMPNELFL